MSSLGFDVSALFSDPVAGRFVSVQTHDPKDEVFVLGEHHERLASLAFPRRALPSDSTGVSHTGDLVECETVHHQELFTVE